MPTSIDYMRERYKVPARIGGRVIFDGKPGTITGSDAHLIIRPDRPEDRPYKGTRWHCHPVWHMVYLVPKQPQPAAARVATGKRGKRGEAHRVGKRNGHAVWREYRFQERQHARDLVATWPNAGSGYPGYTLSLSGDNTTVITDLPLYALARLARTAGVRLPDYTSTHDPNGPEPPDEAELFDRVTPPGAYTDR